MHTRNVVLVHLRRLNLPVSEVNGTFALYYSLRNCMVLCRLTPLTDGVAVLVSGGLKARQARRTAALELASALNDTIDFGSFQIDPKNGEIRFDLTVPTGRSGLAEDVLADSMRHGLRAFDSAFPGFGRLLWAEADPVAVHRFLRRLYPKPQELGLDHLMDLTEQACFKWSVGDIVGDDAKFATFMEQMSIERAADQPRPPDEYSPPDFPWQDGGLGQT
ncbi:MAG: hypothetical protein Q7R48_03835 [bacterium]|nr:hypothetical protein [bacterium]